MNIAELGRSVRRQRRRHHLRQAEVAALAGVGTRFVSELENGKATLEIGRAMRVMAILGLELSTEPKVWKHLYNVNEA